MPGELNGLGDTRELDRLDQPRGTRELDDLALCSFERVRVLGANLHQQSSCFGVEGLPVGGRFVKGLTGCRKRRSDHQLNGRGAEADEARNKGNRFIDRWNWNPCHARHIRRWNRLQYRFGDKRKRTLRADKQASKDLERRFTVEKCAKPQSMGVPDLVLAAHTVRQRRIRQKLSSQLEQAFRN